MIPAIKAEFRKLLSVRSTYVFVGVAALFVIFFAGYIEGWRLSGAELQDPGLYTSDIVGALTSLPMIFGAMVAILLMTHEYRYNTIMYTLTSANRRTKVLVAKFVVILVFGLLMTAFIAALSPFMSYVGVHLHGNTLVAQDVDYGSIVWRALFNGTGFVMAALLLAVLIRSQVGAIVSLFAIPIVEQLLSLLLKHNAVYLPFMSLNSVLTNSGVPGSTAISYGNAALVFTGYLAAGWLVAWILFLKRDAN